MTVKNVGALSRGHIYGAPKPSAKPAERSTASINPSFAPSLAQQPKENIGARLIAPTKILVIEDDFDIRQVISLFLHLSGFEVREALDGRQAIHIIPEFSPDLIVLDLMMHPVNGWEVLDWLREHPFTPPLPVLILTALTQLEEQIHGLEAGAIEYMTKPTQPSKLVERIHALLSLSVEQRAMLQHKRIDERRSLLSRISA